VTEQSWKPLFRAPKSTVTKVLQTPSFSASRKRAGVIIDEPSGLRQLAEIVETIDYSDAPLSAIEDRVGAAVRLLRERADRLEVAQAPVADIEVARDPEDELPPGAASLARVRLIIAALDYLITPVDLVPDFRPGGYVDDVLLLSWVFGAAVHELEPYLDPDGTW
jgi:uncharacterized membrane protein YkvA (DUF1232 family)